MNRGDLDVVRMQIHLPGCVWKLELVNTTVKPEGREGEGGVRLRRMGDGL